MKTAFKISLFGLQDLARSKWIIIYAMFIMLVTEGLFQMGGSTSKVLLSLMSFTILMIPLVSIVFGTMHFYNLREFVQLLLTQPIKRETVYLGVFTSLVFTLSFSYILGVSIPFILHSEFTPQDMSVFYLLLIVGTLLTVIFTGLSFLMAVIFNDKGKGLGFSLLTWLILSILYDGVVLYIAYTFHEYPLEKPMIALSMLNPIDLARVILLLEIDIASLMGYTGAVFERFFGSSLGIWLSLSSMLVWCFWPVGLGIKLFKVKDF